MNNEGVINYNSNPSKITDLKYDIIPGKIENNSKSNIKNKDNNLSKSQNKDNTQSMLNYNENYSKDYYAPSPISHENVNIINNNENYSKDYYAPSPISHENFNIINNNFIQNNNNNNNLIKNNIPSNEFEIINFNDKLDFDISPQKNNGDKNRKDSLEENLNNLDSIEDNNLNNKNSDSLKLEQMAERLEDKKRGKVMDRIVKGRAKLNENNKNDLKSSNIMERAKIYEKVLGNSKRSEESNENINNMNDNI